MQVAGDVLCILTNPLPQGKPSKTLSDANLWVSTIFLQERYKLLIMNHLKVGHHLVSALGNGRKCAAKLVHGVAENFLGVGQRLTGQQNGLFRATNFNQDQEK